MDQETYDDHAAAIRAGRVVSFQGRTAVTIDELDFIASVTKGDDFPPPLEPYAIAPGVPQFRPAQGAIVQTDADSITVTKEEFQAALSEQTKLMEADLAQAQDDNAALRAQNTEMAAKLQEANTELAGVATENLTLKGQMKDLQGQVDAAKTTPAADVATADTGKPAK